MAAPWLTVLTTPARPQYLQATLESIDQAGGAAFKGPKIIFVDGNPAAVPKRDGWKVIGVSAGDKPEGSAAALVNILRFVDAGEPPFLLYFEDDVELCRNAVAFMAGMPVPPDCWALQFCDVKHLADPSGRQQLYRHVTDHHWGTQALKIPPWTLRRVAVSRHQITYRYASDVTLGKMSTSMTAPYLGILAPSIAQHIGAISVCNPTEGLGVYGRSAHNFPGVDFDARTLIG